MKYLIFVLCIFLISCKSKGELCNSIFIISKDGISSDTVVLGDNGNLSYNHTGIGVLFGGEYEYYKNRVSIDVLDFQNPFDCSKIKESVFQFELIKVQDEWFIHRVVNVNSMFDKVRVFSEVRMESDSL